MLQIALRLAVLITVLMALAPASASAALTATGARIGSHPAFVRVVVDFSGGTLAFNTVEAVDPTPSEGAARVEVRSSGIVATPVDTSAQGVRVRISQGTGVVIVRLTSALRTFKYLSVDVLHSPERLVMNLYRSRPPVAGANIRTGEGRCLTLASATREGRGFRMRGTEKELFEANFILRVRDAGGRVVGRRIMTARGAWNARVAYRVTSAQAGTVEAVADSAKDGSLVCIVQLRVQLRP